MKSTAAVCALALFALSFGSLSYAQDFNRRDRHAEPPRFEQRGPAYGGGRDFSPRPPNRGSDHRSPQFDRGDRLPPSYRSPHAVNNRQAQHLDAPARGQQWVQVGANDALIAIATGVIAQLVLNPSR